MDQLGFWTRWGLELSDEEFANAFLVLGILSASSTAKDGNHPGRALSETLSTVLKHSREKYGLLRWRFPKPNQRANIENEKALLSDLNPRQVADAWMHVASGVTIRLQILKYLENEPISPWFRMLFEANPPVQAVHFVLDTGRMRPHLKWPLRLGYLTGNGGEAIVKSATEQWPSERLTRSYKIDRDNANCDIFVFSGRGSQLLRILLDLPGRQKSNLVIVRGRIDDEMPSVKERLAALSSESEASGYVFLKPDTPDDVVSSALNRFVENLSHNYSVDVAVSEAFATMSSTDPVIFLSSSLASFQLENFIESMVGRMMSLPKAARPRIESDSFRMMGIPVDDTRDDLTIPESAAGKLMEYRSAVRFDAESSGASGMARISEVLDRAESEAVDDKQQQRFLQERTLVKRQGKLMEERRAFRKGVPSLICIRIGPPDEMWESLGAEFPYEKLPQDRDQWNLSVILTEPNHLKEPLLSSIRLGRSGPSTECQFHIQPGDYPTIEARVMVLHRGRVLQTGVLKGRVVEGEGDISDDDKITFVDILQVRSHMADLEGRRQYDASFVLNHDASSRPRLTAIAKNHAWLMDISDAKNITENINAELSKVANSVKDYSGGLGSEENLRVLINLARAGRELYGKIVCDQIKEEGNQSMFANMEYLQIVSTKTDALMPLEFIYTAVAPGDGAELCPEIAAIVRQTDREERARKARSLIEGYCREVEMGEKKCPNRDVNHVCPMAFWGISRVIERHMATPRLAGSGFDFLLQSEPTTARSVLQLSGTAVVAASTRVDPSMLTPVLSACAERLGSPPREAKDWEEWVNMVSTYKPRVLLALPHTDGTGANASLEVGGKSILSGQITADHVHAANESTYPVVALLGCDTLGTALDYGSYISWFRREGAALVISTIAKVFGGHAATVAEQLVKGLRPETDSSERIGEVIRSVKRQAIIDGTLMALCVVAFGDADWKLI